VRAELEQGVTANGPIAEPKARLQRPKRPDRAESRSAIVSGMQGEGRRLGIDFGTSSTVAVLAQADGRVVPLLFGETPLLPSAVCVDDGGRLLAGRDALYLGRSRPEHLEPNPKRRIDEGSVLLGEREVALAELLAAVLRRVGEEAARVAAPAGVGATVLTCPAGWGPRRRAVLREAAGRAGLGEVTLVAEPVAAASYFVHVLGNDIPAGHCLLVYDFGAGTFDASVVRRTGDGFTVLAEEGITDAGGLDIDAAIVSYLGAVYATRGPEAWTRLTRPARPADLRANRQLWQDVRDAKEMLSRSATTSIHLPLLEVDAPLGREQLEHLARPVLDRTVAATRTALRVSGVAPGELAGVFLVGGSSRIPLAATLLHRALGIAPTAIEQPELVVAGGSLYAPRTAMLAADPPTAPAIPVARPFTAPAAPVSPAAGLYGSDTSGPVPPASPAAPPASPAGPPAKPPGRAMNPLVTVAAVVAVLAVVVAIVVLRPWERGGEDEGATAACGKKIAFMGAATGAGASIGRPMVQGIRLAVKQYAAAHSCPVELQEIDSQGRPDIAAARTGDLGADVVGLVGPLFSTEINTVGDALERAELPYITPSATNDALSSKGWRTFHRAVGPDSIMAKAAAKYLAGQNRSKIYVVTMDTDYGHVLRDGIRAASGVSIVGSHDFAPGSGFGPLAATVAAGEAQAVFFGGFAEDGVTFVKALRQAGFAGPVVAADGVYDPAFASGLGVAAVQTHVLCSCLVVDDAGFRAAYRAEFRTDPEPGAVVAYDSANFLLDAIAHGADTRGKVAEYVASHTFKGLAGSYRFDSAGELPVELAAVAVYGIGGGGFQFETSVAGFTS
jgi:ABC-type branched-subunit amino acid transport system substrate-binding protein